MKLPSIWLLESAKNLPMILGFVAAARLWQGHLWAALAILLVGMALGVAVTRTVEPRLHKEHFEMRWQNVLMNFALFMAFSIPFIYYFRIENAWLNWKTDLIAGFCAGLLLTLGQSAVWRGQRSRLVLHGLAMTISFPLILICLRLLIQMKNWGAALLLTVCVTLFASLLIAAIDYQEMYR